MGKAYQRAVAGQEHLAEGAFACGLRPYEHGHDGVSVVLAEATGLGHLGQRPAAEQVEPLQRSGIARIANPAERAQRETEQAQLETEQAQRETGQAQLETEQAQRETERALRETERAVRAELGTAQTVQAVQCSPLLRLRIGCQGPSR